MILWVLSGLPSRLRSVCGLTLYLPRVPGPSRPSPCLNAVSGPASPPPPPSSPVLPSAHTFPRGLDPPAWAGHALPSSSALPRPSLITVALRYCWCGCGSLSSPSVDRELCQAATGAFPCSSLPSTQNACGGALGSVWGQVGGSHGDFVGASVQSALVSGPQPRATLQGRVQISAWLHGNGFHCASPLLLSFLSHRAPAVRCHYPEAWPRLLWPISVSLGLCGSSPEPAATWRQRSSPWLGGSCGQRHAHAGSLCWPSHQNPCLPPSASP